MEQHLVVARGSLQRAQLQLARFQWLNEDLLVQGNIGPIQTSSLPSRATVMSEIRKVSLIYKLKLKCMLLINFKMQAFN